MSQKTLPDLVSDSVQLSLDWLQAMAAPLQKLPLGSILKRPLRSDCSCEIPERPCPPHCAAEITWSALPAQDVSATIRVTNAGPQERVFEIAAVPFASGVAMNVSPTALTLGPGAQGLVTVGFTIPSSFGIGTYAAEVDVTGAYTQHVCVTLQVGCDPEHRYATASIEQGDIPVRIRAHHWYDHFQCIEPCFPPRQPIRSGP